MPSAEQPRSPKARRQSALRALVQHRSIRSQAELAELLEAEGLGAVNQATLSRDLRELGIAKGPDGYVLPGAGLDEPDPDPLTRACREWLQAAIPVAHQLVAKTSPGGAHPLALALDQRSAEVPDSPIVGTIAGDDTVLVICRTPRAADRLATDLRSRLPR